VHSGWLAKFRPMSLTHGAKVLNALSWAAVTALIILAVIVADVLGFAGLICLGLLTAFNCTKVELDQSAGSCTIFNAQL
jgi:hypothetical protein